MASSFFELSVAASGLFTTKGALNVIGHNISNAATPGYTRQVAQIKARDPLCYYDGKGAIGTGSEIYGVRQIRDSYIDAKFRTNSGILGEYSSKQTQNLLLQTIFNETSTTGLNASINNLFYNMSVDLSVSAHNTTSRANVIGTAQSLCTYLNTTAGQLRSQQSDINQEVKNMVSQINNLGLQIQNLNKQIFTLEVLGDAANDLRDQRNLIVDELSKYVNVEVQEKELNVDLMTGKSEKHYNVSINGYDFVSHFNIQTLTCTERSAKENVEDIDGLYDIYWPSGVKFNSDYSLNYMSGELKGLLAVRDGNNQNQPSATVLSVTDNRVNPASPTEPLNYTVSLDKWSRENMPEEGNITFKIGGNEYTVGYEDFVFNPLTQKMELSIPPKDGKINIGDKIRSYTELKMSSNGDVSFTVDQPVTLRDLYGYLRIGDMNITKGSIKTYVDAAMTIEAVDGTGNPDGSGKYIKITGSDTPTKLINSVSASTGTTVRFGNNVDYKGIPYLMSKLDTFAVGIARSFNLGQDVHGNPLADVTGVFYSYNMNGEDLTSYTGQNGVVYQGNTGFNFFTYKENGDAVAGQGKEYLDYHKITALNFTVSKELLENPDNLATATSLIPDESDNRSILDLIAGKHNPHVFDEGEYGNFIGALIGEYAVVTRESITFASNYEDMTSAIDNQRLSVSSVDMNEEISRMIQMQQIYNACSKMISVLNGIYDTTIHLAR